MEVWYIDNDPIAGFSFCDMVKRSLPEAKCSLFTEGRLAIIKLLQADVIPKLLFINHQLQSIKCKNVLEFLTNDERFQNIKIVVFSPYFSKAERKELLDLNVYKCLSRISEKELTELTDSLVMSN